MAKICSQKANKETKMIGKRDRKGHLPCQLCEIWIIIASWEPQAFNVDDMFMTSLGPYLISTHH